MQWKLRYTKDSGSISLEAIQLWNNATCACLTAIDVIIERSIAGHGELASRIIIATSKYKEAMELLTLHCELSEDEIENFQSLIDDFFEIWVGIFGDHGVTNYIHMLASGYIHYFLKQYKCLHLYSQQGWEALNGKIQTFIHQSSKRGGHHSGTKNGEKLYIYSAVRLMIRDLLWRIYEADLFFLDLEKKELNAS